MIVVDASVLAPAFAYDNPVAKRARVRLEDQETLFAPEIIDLEVAAAWRGALRARRLNDDRAQQALADLAALRLFRAPHQPLTARVWELRHNFTTYDAAYVALAETLEATLLTSDGRLARAPGLRCAIELIEGSDGASGSSEA
ncbi:MAG: type II toxin-antitoxin system VapC family toxin [Solirubrobacteraceae bacterium]